MINFKQIPALLAAVLFLTLPGVRTVYADYDNEVHEYGETTTIEEQDQTLTCRMQYPKTGFADIDHVISAWAASIYNNTKDEVNRIRTEHPETPVQGELSIQYNSYQMNDRFAGIELIGRYHNNLDHQVREFTKIYNIDLTTRKLIAADQILAPEKAPELLSLMRYKLLEYYPELEQQLNTMDGHWLDTAVLKHDGVWFILDGGAFLPAELGTQHILITYDELGPAYILKPGIDPDKPMVALTFDDGPSLVTPKILKTLEKYTAKATFFMVGNRVGSYPQIVSQVHAQGSEIMGHTWSHKELTRLSKEAIQKEIADTNQAIYNAAGVSPLFVRPPYGAVNNTVREATQEMGIIMVNWSVDPEDWKTKNSNAIYNHIMSKVTDGSIILCHDLYETTNAAMERVIPDLIARGYQLVTVSDLIYHSNKNVVPGEVFNQK